MLMRAAALPPTVGSANEAIPQFPLPMIFYRLVRPSMGPKIIFWGDHFFALRMLRLDP